MHLSLSLCRLLRNKAPQREVPGLRTLGKAVTLRELRLEVAYFPQGYMYFGLKVVPIYVLWGESICYLGTWTLRVTYRLYSPK